MSTRFFRGNVVTTSEVLADGLVAINDQQITYVGSYEKAIQEGIVAEDIKPEPNKYILPGLVDIHSHGGGGASIPNAQSEEEAIKAVLTHRRAGTTSYVASLVTASGEVIKERVKLLADLCDKGELAGIHLEGPFVSHARCGAQDPTYIQTGNPELTKELLDIGRGHVKWMTLAPEITGNQGSGSVAEVLITHRALPSWGHTDSEANDMEQALGWSYDLLKKQENSLSPLPLVTHLFNGMRPIHHRKPGPVMACIAAARQGKAVVEVIADGIHIDPVIVKEIYQIIGRENIALITDAMEAAGMPDGEYQLGSQQVVVKDRVARLAKGDSIAGGTSRLIDVVRVCVEAGISLVDAVYMAATTPARVLNDKLVGELAPGKRADLCITDRNLEVETVIWHGQEVGQ